MLFEDWTLRADGQVLARQFDNLTRTLVVKGEIPNDWEWAMLVQVGEMMDILPLTPGQEGLGIVLTAQQLSVSGYYTMQLRGSRGELVRHTNTVHVYIPASLTGDEKWPAVPSEFTDLERRATEAAQKAEKAAAEAENGAEQAATAGETANQAKVGAQQAQVVAGQSAANASASEHVAAEHKKAAEQAAFLAGSYANHPPVIGENGNWWEWDGVQYADSGKPSRGELTVRQGNTLYANVLKGTASGVVVRMNDVSPLEHMVPVTVRSKNVFNYKAWVEWCNSGIGNTGVEDATYLGEDCFSYLLWRVSGTPFFTNIKFKENTQYTFTFEWGFKATTNPSVVPMLIYYTDGTYSNLGSGSSDQTQIQKSTFVSAPGKTIAYLSVNRYSSSCTIYIKKNMQIEEGLTATEYTPYVSPSSVRLLEHRKNLVEPAAYAKASTNTTVDGDIFTTTFENAAACVNAPWYKPVTNPQGTYTVTFTPVSDGACANILVYAADDGAMIKSLADAGLNNKTSLTFTANEKFYISLAGVSNKANRGTHSYKLQLEVGTTATEYEPYIVPVTYTPTEDGTCEVTSIAPTMTLTTDTEGAAVDCEYNRDINKALEQLTQAIISMGGNI